MGFRRVTLTFGAGADGRVLSAGFRGSIAESFNVGVYRMHDEGHESLRRDDYTEWDLQ